MKTCTKCKVEKDESLYAKNKSKKTGINLWCKDCMRGYRANNIDKIKNLHINWRENNKNKHAEYKKNYRAKNILRCRSWEEKSVKYLMDGYIRKRLTAGTTLKSKDIPISLVEAKRIQMLISRTLKEHQKCKT